MITIFVEGGEYVDKKTYIALREEFEDYRDDSKEHYGPYGPVCQNLGKLDAGECWKCKAERQGKLLEWLRDNLLTDSQLDVTPPGYRMTLRGRPS
jgi:hypothetical protein